MAKRHILNFLTLVICGFLFLNNAVATSNDAIEAESSSNSYLSNMISDLIKSNCKESTLPCTSKLLAGVYAKRQDNLIWIKDGEITTKAKDLFQILTTSYEDGLDPNNYNMKEISQILIDIKQLPETKATTKEKSKKSSDNDNSDDAPTPNIKKLAKLDVLLTDGFLRYVDNIHNGIIDTSKIFPHWKVKKPKVVDPTIALNNALKGNLKNTLNNLKPKYIGYINLKEKLAEYREILANNPWKKVSSGSDLTIGSSGSRVKNLQHRLIISGELGSDVKKFGKFDESTAAAVALFQENMGLLDNGIADSDTIAAMNVPVETRIQQIELNMDIMRHFPDSFGDEYILINIPAYSLNLYKNGKSSLNMDVAVGSSKHQSCILNSKITYLVTNPAWYVPRGIAESEVFPLLQNGTGIAYLKSHNIQTFKIIKGKTLGKNPAKVNWKDMTLKEFKVYRFTQKPGSDNLLGKVKFKFANPCEIYLHDSIESDVFDASERDLSHGCIRMGEPMKLTNYVLTSEGFSESQIQVLFNGKANHTTTLHNPINIDIVYLTSLVNQYNFVQFRDDVYNLLDQYLDLFPVAQPLILEEPDKSAD